MGWCLNSQMFKANYEAKLEFLGGRESAKPEKKPSLGVDMNIRIVFDLEIECSK